MTRLTNSEPLTDNIAAGGSPGYGEGTRHALEKIKEKIVTRRLRPGHLIVEEELADELRLSRTPVRVALAILQEEGLIERVSRWATRVRETRGEEVKEILALRYVIESLVACELARSESTTEDRTKKLQPLRHLLDEAKKDWRAARDAERKDNDEDAMRYQIAFVHKDTEFHSKIAELAGFRLAADLLRKFRHKVLIAFISAIPTVAKMEDIVEDHEAIFEAIKSNEAGTIQASIREHLGQIAKRWWPDYKEYVENLGYLFEKLEEKSKKKRRR